MKQWQQILIVLAILAALPITVRLLHKFRVLPLALYFVLTRLLFPNWAAEHPIVCAFLFAGCVLFTVLAWAFRIIRKRQEQAQLIAELLAKAKPLDLMQK